MPHNKRPPLWFENQEVQTQGFGTIPVSMADTGSEILVRAELPGFNKDEVKVHVTPTTIEISAEKKREKVVQTEKLYKREESFGSTRRVVSLPAVVETESARAKFENGVLAIVIKKKGKRSPAERNVRYG